jgi:uncharacterized protein
MLWAPLETIMHMTLRIALFLSLLALAACAPEPPQEPVAEDVTISPSPVELARSGYEAFARGDIPGVLALMDPAMVWHEAETLPYGGVYHGPDAVLESIFMAIGRDWDDYVAEPLRFIDGGDHAVVLGEYRGVHRASGGSLKTPFAHVWRFRDGRLVEFHQFTDTALWLAAMRGPGE